MLKDIITETKSETNACWMELLFGKMDGPSCQKADFHHLGPKICSIIAIYAFFYSRMIQPTPQ